MAWNRPRAANQQPTEKRGGTKRPLLHGLIVCAIVAVAGVALMLSFSGEDVKPGSNGAKSARVKNVAYSAKNRQGLEKTNADDRGRKPNGEIANAVVSDRVCNADTSVVTNQPDLGKKRSPVFKSHVEKILALAIPSEPGAPIPPVPLPEDVDDDMSDEDRKKFVSEESKRAIVAEEGDSLRILETKARVLEHKMQFLDLMKTEGWTLADYVKAVHHENELNRDYYTEATKTLDEMYNDKSITDEQYKEYHRKINETLAERGFPDEPLERDAAEPQKEKEQ